MSLFQRIKNILIGLAMIAAGFTFITYSSDYVFKIIVLIFSIGLAIEGIRNLVYYFRMARHMISGKTILIQGVIILDFAIITLSFSIVPKIYIFLYLIGVYAFAGAVEVLRAMEAKNTVGGPWKLKFINGLIDFALAIVCLVSIKNQNTSITIYSLGLIYSGIVRILTAFRRTSFILIQ